VGVVDSPNPESTSEIHAERRLRRRSSAGVAVRGE
jgi:hypothetical protein